jgi:hypothetical protein
VVPASLPVDTDGMVERENVTASGLLVDSAVVSTRDTSRVSGLSIVKCQYNPAVLVMLFYMNRILTSGGTQVEMKPKAKANWFGAPTSPFVFRFCFNLFVY